MSFWRGTVGVAQPTVFAAPPSVVPPVCLGLGLSLCWSQLDTVGVGHPPQSLPDVRRTDARSAQIGGPAGISHCFQVKANSGEPLPSKFRRNLFSKDCWRFALGDECVKSGPEVSAVGMASLLSRARKRLTRAASCPDGSLVVPSCESEGIAPSADSGEKMVLVVSSKVVCTNIDN